MAPKNSAEIFVDYPINDISFINNKTILVCGGGGESKSGVPNKITAVRCSFKIKDKSRRLQKFREVNLPKNEDSPLCLAVSKSLERNEGPEFSVLVGCNQSQELRSLNVNNNVRKYTFVENNHFTFQDAAQFDENIQLKPRTEDPKHIQVASDSSVAVMMTTATPSEMVVFNPSILEPVNRISPSIQSEIVDLHLCPYDNGQTITYITSTAITTIYTNTGALVPASTSNAAKTEKTFAKYFFSKVHYIDASRVLLVGSLKSRKGTAVLEYNIQTGKVLKEKTLLSTCRPVALAYCEANGLVAIALNDFSVTLIKAADFKIVKTYKKLHNFAITCLSFCPNGSKLASGSAAQTLNVIKLDSSPGFLWSLFKLFFWAIFIAFFAIGLQMVNQSGNLDSFFDLLRLHGGDAYVNAHKYGKLTYDFSQEYGAAYYEKAQHHGAIYFDLAQRYGKIGLEIAKDKSLEGYSFVLDKVEKWRAEKAATSEFSETPEWINTISETTETPTTIPTSGPSSKPSSALSSSSIASSSINEDQASISSISTTSTQSTLQASSTTNDMMTQVTKKVNTENMEAVDTISLISEAVQQITNIESLKSLTSEATESLGSVYSSAASVASLLVSDVSSSLTESSSTKQISTVEATSQGNPETSEATEATESLGSASLSAASVASLLVSDDSSSLTESASMEQNSTVESSSQKTTESSTVSQTLATVILLSVSSSAPGSTKVLEESTTLAVSSTSYTSIDYRSEYGLGTLSLESVLVSAVTSQIKEPKNETTASSVSQSISENVQQISKASLASLVTSSVVSLSNSITDAISVEETEPVTPSVVSPSGVPTASDSSAASSATMNETTSSLAMHSSGNYYSAKPSSSIVSETTSVGHSASLDFPTEKTTEGQKALTKQKKFSETHSGSEPISAPRAPDVVQPVPETNPKRSPAEPVPESFPSQASSSSILPLSKSETSASFKIKLDVPSSSAESSQASSPSSSSFASSKAETTTVIESYSTTYTASVTSSSIASASETSSSVESSKFESPIHNTSEAELTHSPLSESKIVSTTTKDLSNSVDEPSTFERPDEKSIVVETNTVTSLSTTVIHDEF